MAHTKKKTHKSRTKKRQLDSPDIQTEISEDATLANSEITNQSKRRKNAEKRSSTETPATQPLVRDTNTQSQNTDTMPKSTSANAREIQKIIKKPWTPWICYVVKNRRTRDDGSQEPISAVIKRCSTTWRSLDETARQPYIEASERDNLRYQREYENLSHSQKERLERLKQNAKMLKESNKMSFMAYLSEKQSDSCTTYNTENVVKVARQQWKSMSSKDKKKYKQQ